MRRVNHNQGVFIAEQQQLKQLGSVVRDEVDFKTVVDAFRLGYLLAFIQADHRSRAATDAGREDRRRKRIKGKPHRWAVLVVANTSGC